MYDGLKHACLKHACVNVRCADSLASSRCGSWQLSICHEGISFLGFSRIFGVDMKQHASFILFRRGRELLVVWQISMYNREAETSHSVFALIPFDVLEATRDGEVHVQHECVW